MNSTPSPHNLYRCHPMIAAPSALIGLAVTLASSFALEIDLRDLPGNIDQGVWNAGGARLYTQSLRVPASPENELTELRVRTVSPDLSPDANFRVHLTTGKASATGLPPCDDVLAYFTFDQVSGSTILDVSGQNRHAVLRDGQTLADIQDSPSGSGKALFTEARGGPNINDRLPMGLDWSAFADLLVPPFSIEMLLWPTGDLHDERKLIGTNDAAFQGLAYRSNGLKGGSAAVLGMDSLQVNDLHYLTFVFVNDTEVRVYAQGEFLGTTIMPNFFLPASGVYLVSDDRSRTDQLTGFVESVRICRGRLEDGEVQAHWASLARQVPDFSNIVYSSDTISTTAEGGMIEHVLTPNVTLQEESVVFAVFEGQTADNNGGRSQRIRATAFDGVIDHYPDGEFLWNNTLRYDRPFPPNEELAWNHRGSNNQDLALLVQFGDKPSPIAGAVFPGALGFEFLDLDTDSIRQIPYAGLPPASPMPLDVDISVSNNGQFAVYPTASGLQVLKILESKAEEITWAGPGPAVPLPSGVDVSMAPNSRKAVYPTPLGFEVIDLVQGISTLVPYAGSVAAPLVPDVDVIVSPNGSHALYPSNTGLEALEIASGQSSFIEFSGAGAAAIQRVAIDPVFVSDSKAVYVIEDGFEIVDVNTMSAVSVPYAGLAPILPLPIDVDPVYSEAAGVVVYPSRDGFEVLDVSASAARLIPYSGIGPALPLPGSVDAVVAPNGLQIVYPTPQGVEIGNLQTNTAEFVPYTDGFAIAPLPNGVDVSMAGDAIVIYPTSRGFERIDLTTMSAEVIRYAGTGPHTPLPPAVDVVLSPDGGRAVYPTPAGFEVLDLVAQTSTFVSFEGAGPQTPLPSDIDVVITGNGHVLYPTPQGIEAFDLVSIPPSSRLRPFSSPVTVPTGVDAVSTLTNAPLADEDFILDLSHEPGGHEPPPPHRTIIHKIPWKLDGPNPPLELPFSPEILAELGALAPDGFTVSEIPPGLAQHDGHFNTPLAELGLSMNQSGQIAGVPLFPGHFVFGFNVFDPQGRRVILQVWVIIWIIPHIDYLPPIPWPMGEFFDLQIPNDIVAQAEELFPGEYIWKDAPRGCGKHKGKENVPLDELGLELDPETGRIFGVFAGTEQIPVLLDLVPKNPIDLEDPIPPLNPEPLAQVWLIFEPQELSKPVEHLEGRGFMPFGQSAELVIAETLSFEDRKTLFAATFGAFGDAKLFEAPPGVADHKGVPNRALFELGLILDQGPGQPDTIRGVFNQQDASEVPILFYLIDEETGERLLEIWLLLFDGEMPEEESARFDDLTGGRFDPTRGLLLKNVEDIYLLNNRDNPNESILLTRDTDNQLATYKRVPQLAPSLAESDEPTLGLPGDQQWVDLSETDAFGRPSGRRTVVVFDGAEVNPRGFTAYAYSEEERLYAPFADPEDSGLSEGGGKGFDFDRDGRKELIYATQDGLSVFDPDIVDPFTPEVFTNLKGCQFLHFDIRENIDLRQDLVGVVNDENGSGQRIKHVVSVEGGTFEAPNRSPFTTGTWQDIQGLLLQDCNNDGNLDLIILDYDSALDKTFISIVDGRTGNEIGANSKFDKDCLEGKTGAKFLDINRDGGEEFLFTSTSASIGIEYLEQDLRGFYGEPGNDLLETAKAMAAEGAIERAIPINTLGNGIAFLRTEAAPVLFEWDLIYSPTDIDFAEAVPLNDDREISLSDANNDGLDDIVLTEPIPGGLWIFLSNSDDVLELYEAEPIEATPAGPPAFIHGPDGFSTMYLPVEGGMQPHRYNRLEATIRYIPIGGDDEELNRLRSATAADLNGDQLADLLGLNVEGKVVALLNLAFDLSILPFTLEAARTIFSVDSPEKGASDLVGINETEQDGPPAYFKNDLLTKGRLERQQDNPLAAAGVTVPPGKAPAVGNKGSHVIGFETNANGSSKLKVAGAQEPRFEAAMDIFDSETGTETRIASRGREYVFEVYVRNSGTQAAGDVRIETLVRDFLTIKGEIGVSFESKVGEPDFLIENREDHFFEIVFTDIKPNVTAKIRFAAILSEDTPLSEIIMIDSDISSADLKSDIALVESLRFPPPMLVVKNAATITDNLSADGRVNPGEFIDYRIQVTNEGIQPAVGVKLTDVLDPNTTLLGGVTGAEATLSNDQRQFEADLPDLMRNESIEVSFRVLAASSFPEGLSEIINAATLTSDTAKDVTDSATVPASSQLRFTEATKTVSDRFKDSEAVPGERLEFTIEGKFAGGDLTDLEIVDPIDPNITIDRTSVVAEVADALGNFILVRSPADLSVGFEEVGGPEQTLVALTIHLPFVRAAIVNEEGVFGKIRIRFGAVVNDPVTVQSRKAVINEATIRGRNVAETQTNQVQVPLRFEITDSDGDGVFDLLEGEDLGRVNRENFDVTPLDVASIEPVNEPGQPPLVCFRWRMPFAWSPFVKIQGSSSLQLEELFPANDLPNITEIRSQTEEGDLQIEVMINPVDPQAPRGFLIPQIQLGPN